MVIERKLLEFDEINKNGRVYPRYLWDELFDEIKSHRVIGQLEHPDFGVLNLCNATHIVTNPIVEEDKIFVDVNFLDVEKGRAAAKIVEAIGQDKLRLELLYRDNWEGDKNSVSIISVDLVSR